MLGHSMGMSFVDDLVQFLILVSLVSHTNLVIDLHRTIVQDYPFGSPQKVLSFQAGIAQQLQAREYGYIFVCGQVVVQLTSQCAEVELNGRSEDVSKTVPVFVVVAFRPFESNVTYGKIVLVLTVSDNFKYICKEGYLPGVEIFTDIFDKVWNRTRGAYGSWKVYEYGKS
jgi:hypothetical protein